MTATVTTFTDLVRANQNPKDRQFSEFELDALQAGPSTSWQRICLSRTYVGHASFTDVTFDRVCFEFCRIDHLELERCCLSACRFDFSRIDRLSFIGCTIEDCSMSFSSLGEANIDEPSTGKFALHHCSSSAGRHQGNLELLGTIRT